MIKQLPCYNGKATLTSLKLIITLRPKSTMCYLVETLLARLPTMLIGRPIPAAMCWFKYDNPCMSVTKI